MATKNDPPVNSNINTNNNTNNLHVNVNVEQPKKRAYRKKEKKPNWVTKAIALAVIGLISSIIVIYVKHSTATNGKPAFIQGGVPASK